MEKKFHRHTKQPTSTSPQPQADSSSKVTVLLTRDKSSSGWNVRSEERQQNKIDGLILPGNCLSMESFVQILEDRNGQCQFVILHFQNVSCFL